MDQRVSHSIPLCLSEVKDLDEFKEKMNAMERGLSLELRGFFNGYGCFQK